MMIGRKSISYQPPAAASVHGNPSSDTKQQLAHTTQGKGTRNLKIQKHLIEVYAHNACDI